jgi:uncharacterized protein YbjT (DUF2867 family)
MYAITGITGRIGGGVARALLAANQSVRAVVRDIGKGAAWAERGCELAVADMNDATTVTAAFKGVEGVFVLLPPNFDPTPGFPEARRMATAMQSALEAASPPKALFLSTIGAQATRSNLLTQLTIMEESLRELRMPITFLRPAWFVENYTWDVAAARANGVIPSFLQPLDKPVRMVATADVIRVAATLLQETGSDQRIVELEGPRRVTPNEIAAAFSNILGRPVRAEVVPRETWEELFKSQGMKNPLPRIRMLDGFNEGWIEFEGGVDGSLKGNVSFDTVLQAITEKKA